MRLGPLLLVAALAACSEGREAPAPLAAGSDTQAREVVERFFSAYIAGDAVRAVELMCERDAASRAQAAEFIRVSQAPGSRFRVQSFEVRSVEAGWEEREPLFWVEVAFPRNTSAGELVHRYRVRAKDACVARFLGGAAASQPTSPPEPTPIPAPVPENEPPSAPVDPDDEVIEL